MANPRKFSEKIALLNQKQIEGNAQFEQVMREVSDATKRVSALPNTQKHHLRITQTPRGGSLPNVNHVVNAIVEAKPDSGMGVDVIEELKKGMSVSYHRDPRDRVGPVRGARSAERRIDKSPYANHLALPPDSSWRRTNSDSALHQSASGGLINNAMQCQQQQYDIPGINIYPSMHDQGGLQIPISNNTGSLPDLTCFQFSSPLPKPLDQEDHNTSPGGSCTVSPSGGSLHINRVPSPHAHHQPFVQVINKRQPNFILSPLSPSHSLNEDSIISRLAVPSMYNHSKVVTGDVGMGATRTSPGQQDNGALPPHSYHNSQSPRPSPLNSPSPGSGLTIAYRSQSPHSPHSPHSAPASPGAVSPATSPAAHQSHFTDSYNNYITQSQLQQHFEQFNMDWCQLVHTLVESGTSWSLQMDTPTSASLTYIASPTNNTNSQAMPLSPEENIVQDGGYYSTSPSQMQFGKPGSTQHTTPNTPNTPSSIPDIIVADFSEGPNDDVSKNDLVKDLVQFDTDLFPSDETLREGLGSIDFDGYQMLTDPGVLMISDPTAEDHFRLDRL